MNPPSAKRDGAPMSPALCDTTIVPMLLESMKRCGGDPPLKRASPVGIPSSVSPICSLFRPRKNSSNEKEPPRASPVETLTPGTLARLWVISAPSGRSAMSVRSSSNVARALPAPSFCPVTTISPPSAAATSAGAASGVSARCACACCAHRMAMSAPLATRAPKAPDNFVKAMFVPLFSDSVLRCRTAV
ncbi:hypothetical protein D9M73_133940 [compost metagenome]